mgnify:CR=1 FL=1
MAYKITEIEGIGPSFADKLAAANISDTDHLLDHCATKNGRKAIAEKTGIGESQLLKWSNMADLMRISGVGKQFAELLEAAGVDTVKELRTRNAANLADAMKKINDEKKLTKGAASGDTVEAWITQAKSMDPKISH